MFKKRQFKIRVSGCSGIVLIILLFLLILFLVITVPIYGFFGLSTLLEKFQLAHLTYYEHWYYNILYFGWFLIILFGLVFIIDLIGLFIMASLNLDFTRTVNFVSTSIQFVFGTIIYHSMIVGLFSRVDTTWLGSIITTAIVYMIFTTFTSTTSYNEHTD